jgi:probable rRNA maturation factor
VIYVRNATRKHRIGVRAWQRRARTLLSAAGLAGAGLSLSFVGDRAMRRLNREHRGKDRPTDVLSFPLFEPFAVPRKRSGGGPELLLGDVVISLDTALRQAREYDASLDDEVERLLIHGILHLIGHDHELPDERKRMVRAERRLARAVGLSWPYDGVR